MMLLSNMAAFLRKGVNEVSMSDEHSSFKVKNWL